MGLNVSFLSALNGRCGFQYATCHRTLLPEFLKCWSQFLECGRADFIINGRRRSMRVSTILQQKPQKVHAICRHPTTQISCERQGPLQALSLQLIASRRHPRAAYYNIRMLYILCSGVRHVATVQITASHNNFRGHLAIRSSRLQTVRSRTRATPRICGATDFRTSERQLYGVLRNMP